VPAPGTYDQTALLNALTAAVEALDDALRHEQAILHTTGSAAGEVLARLHTITWRADRLLSCCQLGVLHLAQFDKAHTLADSAHAPVIGLSEQDRANYLDAVEAIKTVRRAMSTTSNHISTAFDLVTGPVRRHERAARKR
jgi:hypothetical protein